MKNRARLLAMLCALAVAMIAAPLFAAYANRQPIVTIDGNRVYFQDQNPIMVENRVLVPVRGVFEHMGFEVTWIAELRTARLEGNGTTVIIPADTRAFVVNGVVVTPDVPQRMVNNRILLPLRAVAEAIGGTAEWNSTDRIAMITSPVNDSNNEPEEPYYPEVPEPEPPIEPEIPYEPEEPTQQLPVNYALVGTWYIKAGYLYTPFYVLEADGTGVMAPTVLASPIRWVAYNGVFAVCITPDICGTVCILPAEYYYELSGERLTLTSRLLPDFVEVFYRNVSQPEQPEPTPFPPQLASFEYTQSQIRLPDYRRQTQNEREAWIAEYRNNGGPSAFELQVVAIINEERIAHGLYPVALDEGLMMAARFYSQMLANNDLPLGSREGPYGGSRPIADSFGARMTWNGGNGNGGGLSARGIVNAWLNSAGHRAYLMAPAHRYIGFGSHVGGRFSVQHYLLFAPLYSLMD